MRKLSKEQIIKNQVDTVNQYKVLMYLKSNLNIKAFNVYLYDKNTIKIIDKNNDVGYFTYDNSKQEILFSDKNILYELER